MSVGRPRQFDLDEALGAALQVFWRKGYEGTSLPDLTEAMGINRPSLYAAFGNKASLFRKAVERYLSGPAGFFNEALKAPTARAAVARLLEGSIDMVTEGGNPRGCFLVQSALACGDEADDLRREMAKKRTQAETALRLLFQQAINEKDLPACCDPAILAKYITVVNHGLAVQAAGGAPADAAARVGARPRPLPGPGLLRRRGLRRVRGHGLPGAHRGGRAARHVRPYPPADPRAPPGRRDQAGRARGGHDDAARLGAREGLHGPHHAARDQQGHVRRVRSPLGGSWLNAAPPVTAIEIAAARVTVVGLAAAGGSGRRISGHATEPLPPGVVVPGLAAPIEDIAAIGHCDRQANPGDGAGSCAPNLLSLPRWNIRLGGKAWAAHQQRQGCCSK